MHSLLSKVGNQTIIISIFLINIRLFRHDRNSTIRERLNFFECVRNIAYFSWLTIVFNGYAFTLPHRVKIGIRSKAHVAKNPSLLRNRLNLWFRSKKYFILLALKFHVRFSPFSCKIPRDELPEKTDVFLRSYKFSETNFPTIIEKAVRGLVLFFPLLSYVYMYV